MTLGTPLNTALLLYIVYSVHRVVFPEVSTSSTVPHELRSGYSWMPKSHPPTVLYTTYTPKTLEHFNGRDGGRILLAINGIVFDVSSGRNFYGPQGMYGNFAGRDASRGMAKQSFDMEMLTPVDKPLDKLDDLTPDEIDNMNGWIEHFSAIRHRVVDYVSIITVLVKTRPRLFRSTGRAGSSVVERACKPHRTMSST